MCQGNSVGERRVFPNNDVNIAGFSDIRKWIRTPFLYDMQRLTQKWIMDLKVRAQTIKLFEEKNRSKASWLWIMQMLLRCDTKTQDKTPKQTDNLDFIKIKYACCEEYPNKIKKKTTYRMR